MALLDGETLSAQLVRTRELAVALAAGLVPVIPGQTFLSTIAGFLGVKALMWGLYWMRVGIVELSLRNVDFTEEEADLSLSALGALIPQLVNVGVIASLGLAAAAFAIPPFGLAPELAALIVLCLSLLVEELVWAHLGAALPRSPLCRL